MRSHLHFLLKLLLVSILISSCGVYSFTGSSTNAKTISIADFYNNADLGPANMGTSFTNKIKTYFIQNASLDVVADEGELQLLEGEIRDYRLTPIAPVSTGDPNAINNASSTRLTITVKVTYVNMLDDSMSFKDKTFSFYKDFTNDQDFADIQEQLTNQIFTQIIQDIFNASVANW